MIRSARELRNLLGLKNRDQELSDERILGSRDFIASVLKEAEIQEKRKSNHLRLDEAIARVCKELKISEDELYSSSKKRMLSQARAIISFLGAKEMGYKVSEISKILRVNQPGITKAVERGYGLFLENSELKERLLRKE